MKIIALFPIKNDRWILDTTIPQLKKFVDEICCLDGGSMDGTIEVLKSYGVLVKQQDQTNLNYSSWRQELLDWGRERGGTHFVWLDSDEAFTSNLMPIFTTEILKLKPGQKLVLQWLCLWKNPRRYRHDRSIWSDLHKDFVFCDDGKSAFENVRLHEGRTPGKNNESTLIKLPVEKGAVLHFQFVPFERFQAKQAYQRCRELILGGSPRRINLRYAETLDNNEVAFKDIPHDWLEGMANLESIPSTQPGWFIDEIYKFFSEKGILTFETLEIWHVPELYKKFKEEIGREPRVKKYSRLVVVANTYKNKLRKILYGK